MKKNYFSSHKLPKQQLASFWSQGILGVNKNSLWTHTELEFNVLGVAKKLVKCIVHLSPIKIK
jgi:hypothetical protein